MMPSHTTHHKSHTTHYTSQVNIDAMDVDLGFGAAALSRTEEHMIELHNGCICCTLRGDLLDSVSSLVAAQRFMHIIIESTCFHP